MLNKVHNHPPKSDDFFESTKIRSGVKRRISLDPSERPQKAVDMTIKHVLGDTLDGRDLRRFVATAKRKKQSKKPKIPKSTKEVEKSLREIVRKERFVEGFYAQFLQKQSTDTLPDKNLKNKIIEFT